MNGHRWFTRQDVLDDLAQVTGIPVDFDDNFIVRGEKPPPPAHHLDDEGAEYHLRFGGVTDHGDQVTVEPDLAGITQMLRMVNNLDTPNDEDTVTKTDETLENVSTMTISKLDPSVEEFVPKCVPHSDPDVKRKVNLSVLENIKKEIIKACTDKVVKTVNHKSIEVKDNKGSGDKYNEEEKIRIAEMLKSKIIKSSNAKTLQNKKEKNVAIAALLKLHSTPPDSDTPKVASVVNSPKKILKDATPNASSSPKPILFPPEYYEAPSCSTKVNVDIPEVKTTAVEVQLPQPIDPHIQESINKVNNWLNKPETPKPTPPMACLEPVAFKKKEASSSSSSVKTTKQPISSPSPRNFVKVQPISAIPSFVPSSYASDLAKTYEDRNKEREAQVDIWTKLEKDLKAKDEDIRKKREHNNI